MSIHENRRLVSIVLVAVAACACNRGPATENREYPAAPATVNGGLVAPLKDDTSAEIVSWVDGQVVTDWTAEITKRERAIEGYLDDADPVRAEKYGFRSGQNPRLAWSWFRDNPVGFNGVPYVLLKTMLDLDPNHANPALRAIARIWKHEAIVPAGSGTPATAWTLDHIGVGPNPSDYVDGAARPASQRQSPLPFGFAFENARSFEPLSAAQRTASDARLLARRVFQNTSLLIAKVRTADKEENWERDRPGFGSPGTMDRVFLSCAACHVGRVMVSGRMKFLAGMPNTEIEAQYYSKLLMLTGCSAGRVRLRPRIHYPCEPCQHQAQDERRPGLVHRDAGQGASAAGNAVRLLSGADRARKDSGPRGGRRVPERRAGSHRRWREDAFHLPRRGQEQCLQTAAP